MNVIAANALVGIYNSTTASSTKNLVIEALGNCGGDIAANALVKIYNSTTASSTKNLVVEALGNCGKNS